MTDIDYKTLSDTITTCLKTNMPLLDSDTRDKLRSSIMYRAGDMPMPIIKAGQLARRVGHWLMLRPEEPVMTVGDTLDLATTLFEDQPWSLDATIANRVSLPAEVSDVVKSCIVDEFGTATAQTSTFGGPRPKQITGYMLDALAQSISTRGLEQGAMNWAEAEPTTPSFPTDGLSTPVLERPMAASRHDIEQALANFFADHVPAPALPAEITAWWGQVDTSLNTAKSWLEKMAQAVSGLHQRLSPVDKIALSSQWGEPLVKSPGVWVRTMQAWGIGWIVLALLTLFTAAHNFGMVPIMLNQRSIQLWLPEWFGLMVMVLKNSALIATIGIMLNGIARPGITVRNRWLRIIGLAAWITLLAVTGYFAGVTNMIWYTAGMELSDTIPTVGATTILQFIMVAWTAWLALGFNGVMRETLVWQASKVVKHVTATRRIWQQADAWLRTADRQIRESETPPVELCHIAQCRRLRIQADLNDLNEQIDEPHLRRALGLDVDEQSDEEWTDDE